MKFAVLAAILALSTAIAGQEPSRPLTLTTTGPIGPDYRLLWDQIAPSAAEANDYQPYVKVDNGAEHTLPKPTCTATGQSREGMPEFLCNTDLTQPVRDALSLPGSHQLLLRVANATGTSPSIPMDERLVIPYCNNPNGTKDPVGKAYGSRGIYSTTQAATIYYRLLDGGYDALEPILTRWAAPTTTTGIDNAMWHFLGRCKGIE